MLRTNDMFNVSMFATVGRFQRAVCCMFLREWTDVTCVMW